MERFKKFEGKSGDEIDVKVEKYKPMDYDYDPYNLFKNGEAETKGSEYVEDFLAGTPKYKDQSIIGPGARDEITFKKRRVNQDDNG